MLLITLAYDSILATYASVACCFKEFFKIRDENTNKLKAVIAVVLLLLSQSMTPPGGIYVVLFMSTYAISWNALIVLLLSSLAIGIYGE